MPKSSAFYTQTPFSVSNQFTEVALLHASENGYSEVYSAERHGKQHVLKCLTPQECSNPRYQQLLRKEFDISYQLSHPGIVHTLGMEEVDGLGVCVIQEYVDGMTWSDFFAAEVSGKEKRQILMELCDAIDYMHQHQVIHRDLKPQNILITRNGHHPVIIDFGLADHDCFVVLKEPAGTTGYASPEQQRPGVLDNRSDIYSLGVLIDQQVSLRDICLRGIARKCLANNPEKRYVSAGEIKTSLMPMRWWRWSVTVVVCLLGIAVLVLYNTAPVNQDSQIHSLQKQNAAQQARIDSMQARIKVLTSNIDSVEGQNKKFADRVNEEDQKALTVNAAKADLRDIARRLFNEKWQKHTELSDSAYRKTVSFNDVYTIPWESIVMSVMKKHHLDQSPEAPAVKNVLREEWFVVLYDMQK